MYSPFHRLPASQLFQELDMLQRGLDRLNGARFGAAGIRGANAGAFPSVNVGTTADSVEIFAFAPGVDPSELEVTVDQGLLTLAGKRNVPTPQAAEGEQRRPLTHARERFQGSFKRVFALPEDADPGQVSARYEDGVLRISVKRVAPAQPRRITVQ